MRWLCTVFRTPKKKAPLTYNASVSKPVVKVESSPKTNELNVANTKVYLFPILSVIFPANKCPKLDSPNSIAPATPKKMIGIPLKLKNSEFNSCIASRNM